MSILHVSPVFSRRVAQFSRTASYNFSRVRLVVVHPDNLNFVLDDIISGHYHLRLMRSFVNETACQCLPRVI